MTQQVAFDGQVVVVTGGGRGIGRAHSLDLANRGARVVVNDRAPEHADAVVAEIEQAGGSAAPSYDDIGTAAGGQALIDVAVQRFGTVDAVIHNAGNVSNGYFEDLTEEQIDAVIAVHLKGGFFVGQPAWRIMKDNGYGRIVLTCSSTGMFSHQGMANYAAAKAGVYGLTKALAYEGRPHNINVNCVLPGAATTISDNDPIPGFDVDWGGSRQVEQHAGGERTWSTIFETLQARRTAHAVAPMVTYLASSGCEVSGEAFIAMAGWYGRVFVGKAKGYLAPDTETVVAEDIAAHFGGIRDLSEQTVPADTFEDMAEIADAVNAAAKAVAQ
jgi:NAD(P)-dependent dehydrogenase (short-subunit alcohol dehydrogenase family)